MTSEVRISPVFIKKGKVSPYRAIKQLSNNHKSVRRATNQARLLRRSFRTATIPNPVQNLTCRPSKRGS
jgi:hypothetical protein